MSGAAATSARNLRRAIVLLAMATAVVVAIEFIVVGLLPVMARDLGHSVAETGLFVSAFALSAAVLGPPLTLAASRQPPRRVLVLTLSAFAAGNIMSVLLPAYEVVLTARIIQGAALPVLISTGAATVTALAPPEQRGQALALANVGFVIGIVVALPGGVALANAGQWTPSFLIFALLALAAAGLVGTIFPLVPDAVPVPWRQQAALLIRPLFLAHLALSVAVFSAMFASYTYLAAWLEQVAGHNTNEIALTLAGFGAAGMIGNVAAARLADHAPLTTTLAAAFIVALASILVSLVHARPLLLYPLLAGWGAAHMAAITLCQVRVTLAGGAAAAFAMAMNIASANLGIALGAFIGGTVVDRWGIGAIGWGAAGLTTLVVAIAAVIGQVAARPRSSHAPADTAPHRSSAGTHG